MRHATITNATLVADALSQCLLFATAPCSTALCHGPLKPWVCISRLPIRREFHRQRQTQSPKWLPVEHGSGLEYKRKPDQKGARAWNPLGMHSRNDDGDDLACLARESTSRPQWIDAIFPSKLTKGTPGSALALAMYHQRMIKKLDSKPLADAYEALRSNVIRGMPNVQLLVAYLIRRRGEKIGLPMYLSLIECLCDSRHGSAAWVASYFRELREEGLEPDADVCNAALKVLAVHPHHIIRNEILDHMRTRWYPISDAGRHYVVAGQLREGQFEMALDGLDSILDAGIKVVGWLYEMTTLMLVDAGEIDAAIHVAQLCSEHSEHQIHGGIWFRTLDAASGAFNHAATVYVWKRRVEPGYLNPSSGQCINVLKTAAQHGDTELAKDVFRILGKRHSVFDSEHYELLLDTYVRAGDLENALSLLCVMADAKLQLTDGSTRKLVHHLKSSAGRRERAYRILSQLKSVDKAVPPAALNALIEAEISCDLGKATLYYDEFHSICGVGPNLETFNMMLRGCTRKRDEPPTAMYLVEQMVQNNIAPDALTYDRLMLVCCVTGRIDDAFGYFFEMQRQNFKTRRGTLFTLAKMAAAEQDVRLPKLIEALGSRGPDVARAVSVLRESSGKEQRGQAVSGEAAEDVDFDAIMAPR